MSKNVNIADLINYISVDGSGNVVLTTGGQIATQSYVTTAVSNLVNSAPSTLDTLNELATALGNDANFATTVTNSIATKLPLSGGTLTGNLNFNSIYGSTISSYSGTAWLGFSYKALSHLWEVNGSNAMVLGANGLGIGTVNPQYKLDVNGTIGLSGAYGSSAGLYLSGTTYGMYGANRGASSASAGMNYYSQGSQKWFTGIYENTENFGFYNASLNGFRLVITPEGNVGVGTTAPNARLDLGSGYGASGEKFLIYNDNTGSALAGTKVGFYMDRFGLSNNSTFVFPTYPGYDGTFIIASKNTGDTTLVARMAVRGESGHVGIGTTSPSHRLHVSSGNIYCTDTIFGRNIRPDAWAGPVAGSPTGAPIPLGYSSINISSLCDNNWRTLITNINDSKVFMWVTLGDAASKDTASYTWQMTSPAYGVLNFANISYMDGGWNTGGFEFTYGNPGNGMFSLMVRCSSYYNSGNTAYGTIYFLRLE